MIDRTRSGKTYLTVQMIRQARSEGKRILFLESKSIERPPIVKPVENRIPPYILDDTVKFIFIGRGLCILLI